MYEVEVRSKIGQFAAQISGFLSFIFGEQHAPSILSLLEVSFLFCFFLESPFLSLLILLSLSRCHCSSTTGQERKDCNAWWDADTLR